MPFIALRDDPLRADVIAFLAEHLADMRRISPPESMHALAPAALAKGGVAFWTVREAERPIGCGALAPLGDEEGELKSMRTAHTARGRGVATALVSAIVTEARTRGYRRLLLETGTEQYFQPARALYERAGFRTRGPFGTYREDPNSAYYELALDPGMAETAERF